MKRQGPAGKDWTLVEQVQAEEPVFARESRVRYLQTVVDGIRNEQEDLSRFAQKIKSVPTAERPSVVEEEIKTAALLCHTKAVPPELTEQERLITLLLARHLYKECSARLTKVLREISSWSRPRRQSEITQANIDRAHAFPMNELVGEKVGGKVLCPGHADRRPSATVYADHVHCFSCGFHADPIDWLQKTRGLSFIEAIKVLAP